MQKVSPHNYLRNLRNLSPDVLTETVTLRHFDRVSATEGPAGDTLDVAWEGDVWASYEDRVGSIAEAGEVEYVGIDAAIACRSEQGFPVDISELVANDEAVRGGFVYTVEYVEKGAYNDGVVIYLSSKSKQ